MQPSNGATPPPIPPKIAEAIIAVTAGVGKLAKTEKNKHGDYKFASIDQFLSIVGKECAAHGLIIVMDEDEFELREGWLMFRWLFTLAHTSGETWDHRLKRSIMINSKMGAQAFGAAQSYAEKQFMRSLFKIATGDDDDADFHKQEDLPNNARTAAKPKAGENKMTDDPGRDTADPAQAAGRPSQGNGTGEDADSQPRSWSNNAIPAPAKANDTAGWKQFCANFNHNMKAALGDASVDLARFNKWVDAHEPALTELGNVSATGRDFLDEQIVLMQGNLSQKASA